MTRRLVLRRETLAELRAVDLAAVAAAALPTTAVAVPTMPLGTCVENLASRVVECDSFLRPCISNTCTR